jgi:1-acyl-sn-glycerol-3-phosphate acyltransferase
VYPPELPPVSNKALYAYRVFMKWFAFFFFGLGTLVLLTLIFPPMRLVLHPRERFKKYGRRFVSSSMRFYLGLLRAIGIVKVEAADREKFRSLKSKIIAANHPSLLDIIVLLSLIPNADCIVNAYLARNLLGGVIRQLYIFNSLDIEDLLKACTESLKQGNCLIVFPEGTRTPRQGKIIFKKGAARVVLNSDCNILPVHIGGTDKYGLGKKDPWVSFNPVERYIYQIRMKDEIPPEKFKTLPNPIAVKNMTGVLFDSLISKTNAE